MALPINLKRVHGPLSSDQIDDNFVTLATAIETLQTLADEGVQIEDITVTDDGTALIIMMSDGRSYGPFTIPTAGFRFMGPWVVGIGYQRLDVMTRGVSSYICTVPHVSGAALGPGAPDFPDAAFDEDLLAGRWMLLAGGSDQLIVPVYNPEAEYPSGQLMLYEGAVFVSVDGEFRPLAFGGAKPVPLVMHLRGSGTGGILAVGDRAVVVLPSGLAIAAEDYAMLVHALDPAGADASIALEMRHRLPDGTETVLATIMLADDERATISETLTEEYGFGEADAVYVVVTDIVGDSAARDIAVTLNTVDIG